VAIYGFRGALVMHTLRASTDILDPRELGVAADVGDDEQWSPGPWKTAKQPAATPAPAKPARRAPAVARTAAPARAMPAARIVAPRRTGATATDVGGVRVLDFTAALKRRCELGSLSSSGTLPRQRRRTVTGSARRSVGRIE
jgi:hypothetical protein